MEKTLEIAIKPVDGKHQVVDFNGEFDKAGHSAIKTELNKLVADFQAEVLIFNLAHLKFINSEGIGYLMEIHTGLSGKGKKLVIVGANAHVTDVFKTVGLHEMVPLHKSLSAFLSK